MKIGIHAVRSGRGLVERSACHRLHALASAVPVREAIVELGAYRGRTTGWLVAGSQGAHVWSIDPWETLADDAVDDDYAAVEPAYRDGRYHTAGTQWREHVEACGITPTMASPWRTTSLEAAADWDARLPVGLLFHDALHSYDAVHADLTAWLPHLAERCVVALHDLGCPAYGVEAAAHDTLAAHGFDWHGRERLLWRKNPLRRGLLVVHRR